MSDDKRKELNLRAGRLIQFEMNLIDSPRIQIAVTENEFDVLQENGFVGYAEYYLKGSYNESELRNEAEIEIFKELLEIDSQLGTTPTKQLFGCVSQSLRMDLIKVRVIFYS